MESLVSTEWLAERINEPDVVILDATSFMPASGRNGHAEYLLAHIPGARFFDIEALRDRNNPAPHMLPPADEFAKAMAELGVSERDRIIVYDNSPLRTAARAWFMLRHFGARSVAILDGGFQKWTDEKRSTQSGEVRPPHASFTPNERDELVSKEELLAGNKLPWIDARSRARFEGAEADPRPGIAAGHAPGARNLPFGLVYREDGTFKTAQDLQQLFADIGVDPRRPFVASCGSGVTANSLIFAAHLLGNDATRLYDGSWSEWGADPTTPKVIGPA